MLSSTEERELGSGVPRYRPMQSIFRPTARRDKLRVQANVDRRDGGLKMDWTKPLHDARPYGY